MALLKVKEIQRVDVTFIDVSYLVERLLSNLVSVRVKVNYFIILKIVVDQVVRLQLIMQTEQKDVLDHDIYHSYVEIDKVKLFNDIVVVKIKGQQHLICHKR